VPKRVEAVLGWCQTIGYMTIRDSTARYPNPAQWCGAVPPLAWRLLIERAAGL